MPAISITLLPGYIPETEQRFVHRVAQATRFVIAPLQRGPLSLFTKLAPTNAMVVFSVGAVQPVSTLALWCGIFYNACKTGN